MTEQPNRGVASVPITVLEVTTLWPSQMHSSTTTSRSGMAARTLRTSSAKPALFSGWLMNEPL